MSRPDALARVSWPRADGAAIDCREKIRVLEENRAELEQVLRDSFDDAVLMGVDPEGMRRILHGMVDALSDPRRTPSTRA